MAIAGSALDSDYLIDFDRAAGKFDLIIQKVQYDRDNGQFECKIKEEGTGAEIKSRTYLVTILSRSFFPHHVLCFLIIFLYCDLVRPGPPIISPSKPIAKEGEPFRLTCSSEGGSPDPIIHWYRDDVLLEGEVVNGGTRSQPTSNTLLIDPTLDLDSANYKCSIWNRATSEENKLEESVSLTVHCKYYNRMIIIIFKM